MIVWHRHGDPGTNALSDVPRVRHGDSIVEENAVDHSVLTADPVALSAATPPDRDRYLDLLRALAIAAVVLGHWLVAIVWMHDGQLHATTVIDVAPATRWLTWVVQVMPLFFLVGGVVNSRSWRATTRHGGSYAGWIGRRAARLLRPTTVLVWAWVALASVAVAGGVERPVLLLATRSALVPLWFLAVYLLLIALVPPLVNAYDRVGLWLPVACLVAAAMVDAMVDPTVPALINYLLVWAVPTVLGFAWADDALAPRAVHLAGPAAALVALVAAVTVFDYPVSMVGLTEAGNDGPNVPLVTVALLGCVQVGVAYRLRPRAEAWLRCPRRWAWVVRLNAVAMTVYLWHLTVLVLVAGALTLSGAWWSIDPLSVAWWLTRPLWFGVLLACLTPLVIALAPIEHGVPPPRTGRDGHRAALRALVAVITAVMAIAVLTLGGAVGASAVVGAAALTAVAIEVGAFTPVPAVGG